MCRGVEKLMSESYESILEAARRLTADEQRELAERLLAGVAQTDVAVPESDRERDARQLLDRILSRGAEESGARTAAESGRARRHFGAWDSGDERSADNERIDRDLAREYAGPR
jgi:hypothetical protein